MTDAEQLATMQTDGCALKEARLNKEAKRCRHVQRACSGDD